MDGILQRCCCDGVPLWQKCSDGTFFSTSGVVGAPVVGNVYEVFLGFAGPTSPIDDLSPCATYMGLAPKTQPHYPLVNAILPHKSCEACIPPVQTMCVATWVICTTGAILKTFCRLRQIEGGEVDVQVGQVWRLLQRGSWQHAGYEFCATVVSVQTVPRDRDLARRLKSYWLAALEPNCDACLGIVPPEPCTGCGVLTCPDLISAIDFPMVTFQSLRCGAGTDQCCSAAHPVPAWTWVPALPSRCNIPTTALTGLSPFGATCSGSCSGTPPHWQSFSLSCINAPGDPGCTTQPPAVNPLWVITASFHNCTGGTQAPTWVQAVPRQCPRGVYVFRHAGNNPPGCCGAAGACRNNLPLTTFEVHT